MVRSSRRGFIGGNKTYDGALAMAVKAVEWS